MILGTPMGDKHLRVAARPANPYGAFAALNSDTFTGRSVSPEGALALSNVYGAVSLIANTAGTLPLEVIEDRGGTKRVIADSQLARMLKFQPNEDMSASALWTLVFNHLLLRGNAYLAKMRDARGFVTELYPLHPANVTPFRDDEGRKRFMVQLYDTSESFVNAVFSASDVLHIMGPSFDRGLSGASPIAVLRNRLGVQLAQSEFQARFYQQGYQLKGALTTDLTTLSEEAVRRIKDQWRSTYSGLDNAHDIAVLHSGVKFQPVSITPEDAQFIETMRFGATEIATMFNLPASRINADSGSSTIKYANVGQDDLHFVKSAVLPRLRMVEDALNIDVDLFGASAGSYWFPKFNVDSALRADIKTRFEAYRIGVEGGWLGVDEVRVFEDLPAGAPVQDSGVKVPNDVVRELQDRVEELRAAHRQVDPEIRVHVAVPEQPAPVVHVAVPEQPAPVLNVDLAAVREMAAPVVQVNVPEQPAPTVNVNVPEQPVPIVHVDVAAPEVTVEPRIEVSQAAKSVQFERDSSGRIVGANVEEK